LEKAPVKADEHAVEDGQLDELQGQRKLSACRTSFAKKQTTES